MGNFVRINIYFQTVIALNLLEMFSHVEVTTQQTKNYTNTDAVKNFLTGKSFLQRLQILLIEIIAKILTRQETRERDFWTQHLQLHRHKNLHTKAFPSCVFLDFLLLPFSAIVFWVDSFIIHRARILTTSQFYICAIKYHMVSVVVLLYTSALI